MSNQVFPGDMAALGIYPVMERGSGVKGDGTTDDAAALNAYIANTPVGATILFQAKTYAIGSSVIFLPNRKYVGEGWAYGGTGNAAVLKQINSTNMTETASVSGLFVAQGWYNNASTSDGPVTIRNMMFNGNYTNNASSTACGIVLQNFWSIIEDCYFSDLPLDGIRLTDTGRNGSTQISNSASENRILRCKVATAHGCGIRQVCNNNISNMDGFCEGNTITTTTSHGISFDRGAGWSFTRNHLYTINGHAIWLNNSYATRVTHNYIEDFGSAGANSTFYKGIYIGQLNGRGSVVTGNFIGCSEVNGGSGGSNANYKYIHVQSLSSQSDAHATIFGNIIESNGSPTAGGFGVVTENNSGTLRAHYGLNHVYSVNNPYSYLATTPTAAAGANAGTSPPAPTVTSFSDDRRGSVQFGSGSGSPAAGAQVVVTFSASKPAAPPPPVLGSANAATVAKQPYVSSVSATAFTISFATAPATSQGGTTYEVTYAVLD